MNMKNYAPWQAPLLSFFSADLYRSVVSNWRGVAYGYFFLLTAFLWLLLSLRFGVWFAQSLNSMVMPTIAKFPTMTLKDGELSLNKKSPYVVKTPDGKRTVCVFDTSDGPKNYPDAAFLVTKHNLIMQSMTSTTHSAKEYSFESYPNGEMDGNQINGALSMVPGWVTLGMFVFMTCITFFWGALLTLIYGAIANAIAGSMQIALSYGEAVRLAVVAFTPAQIITTIAWLVPLPIDPAIILVLDLAIALGYLIFGVKANAVRTVPSETPIATE